MAALEEEVVNAADRFESAAMLGHLYTLADLKDKPADEVDRSELTKNYTRRMSRKEHPARDEYDRIMAAAPFGRCPLCGHRDVGTLDHQLPKMAYPLLAVVPFNLVPACRSCNTTKGESSPTSTLDQTLHPYFDDVGKDQWLFAHLTEEPPASVVFFVSPPPAWDSVLTTRALGHFRKFGLAALYGPQAAQEMSSLRYILKRKPPSMVGPYLQDEAAGLAEENPNQWRAAMYQALASSSWYINGGFALE
ncbi:HNH endonuclease [Streptacidiphilus albus]|uniref:HNH endonuclease n=1 Tax=Streptacidiphilus albus TaxID=105425 RepID=UPI00128D98F5|nr:hypothetical protein [Streptacidiphilus albus]